MDILAIIIPYRNRQEYLERWMRAVYPHLRKNVRIIVCEQSRDRAFNRGAVLNAGFMHALKLGATRVIFHDCDLLPSRDLFDDYFAEWPRPIVHFGCRFSRYNNDSRYFGGVVGFEVANFPGFSNRFYGWGGEDDSLRNRVDSCDIYYPEHGDYIDMENYRTAREKLASIHPRDKCMRKREILASDNPRRDNARSLSARVNHSIVTPPGLTRGRVDWLHVTLSRISKRRMADQGGHLTKRSRSRAADASPPRRACTPECIESFRGQDEPEACVQVRSRFLSSPSQQVEMSVHHYGRNPDDLSTTPRSPEQSARFPERCLRGRD